MPRYRLDIRKEGLGFSAAHFTLFPGGRAERLHGHNYRTELALEGDELQGGLLLDFTEIKKAVRGICDELDERMLLPTEHPDLEVQESEESVEVRCHGKAYRFPREDVRLLPLANSTVEELARHLGSRLLETLGPRLREAGVTRFAVGVEETPGQSGRYQVEL
jgi:6-pyruvoyltetrahydropterin/6-carboxytetrahydropterin synthase